ncbi:MAG TPA: phosphatidate cytidylyltransferase [Allosphingosinicella sp.]|nr:phosphatidate cytidylyltransferase [Allosphingosinicella sp.]
MSEAKAKTGSDLATRFVAAVVMIAIACAAIYVGGWVFRLLVAAGAAVMLIEWGDMHRTGRTRSYAGVGLLVLTLLTVTQYLYPAGEIDVIGGVEGIFPESFDQLWLGFAVVAALACLYGLFSRRVSAGWGFFYIGAPAFALMVLEWARFDLVFWAMLVTWSTDIFAYFAGRSIGGPKLAPRISPNKTWAGLIGGMAGAAVIGGIAAWLFGLDLLFVLAGALMGLLSQLGDLYESKVKRRLGVKDSGTLLPGHGGMLDRVDGLLPVAIATLALLLLVLRGA